MRAFCTICQSQDRKQDDSRIQFTIWLDWEVILCLYVVTLELDIKTRATHNFSNRTDEGSNARNVPFKLFTGADLRYQLS